MLACAPGRPVMKSVFYAMVLLLPLPLANGAATEPPAVDYLKEIKPVLKERCYACHGALQQKAGLRVDTGELIRRGGKDGPVVTNRLSEPSELWRRITTPNRDERMPPEGEALSAAQKDRFRRWLAEGAPSPVAEQPEPEPREHWAFRTPQRPELPKVQRGSGRMENPIDAFIIREMATRELVPAPPARREIQLRRVCLDLTGLPPTREELLAFLADESADAYERVVDRLLASTAYAQRWARHWMDIWRYADWYGRRQVPDVWNSAPQVWRWRDWLVDALRADKGYDAMLTEMLAADEVLPVDDAARVATGYLVRNWYALNKNQWMRDIVEHTGKAFLGLTFNCAHCHDHKYDPITQRNYFEFRAFFEPLQVRQDWIEGQPDPGPFQPYQYSTLRKVATHGMVSVFDERLDAKTWIYERGDERNVAAGQPVAVPAMPAFLGGAGLKIETLRLPPVAASPGLKDFVQRALIGQSEKAVTSAEAAWRAAEATLLSARETAARVEITNAPAGRITALAGVLAGESRARQHSNEWVVARMDATALRSRLAAERARGSVGDSAEVERTAIHAYQAEKTAAVQKAETALGQAADALALLEAEQTLAAVRRSAEGTTLAKAEQEKLDTGLKKAREARVAAEQGVHTNRLALEANDRSFTPPAPTYPAQSSGRRRALAGWLTGRTNPLTARVAVNHIWARHFHAPIVATVFDFGRNGARPTHPELLDWLAVEFMEHDWSMKHLHRLIVTSATYRQAGSGNAGNQKRDPENRYLWRMNPGQMEAEIVRDSILHLAGDLDLTPGGPSIPNTEAEKSCRRSVYFECFPEPGGNSQMAELFDPPSSLDCYRRTTTVVPQQALALSNSTLSVERSRHLADRLPAAGDDDAFIHAAYLQVLARRPTAGEVNACQDFLTQQRRTASPPEVRASLVHVLFNHHDFVSIR